MIAPPAQLRPADGDTVEGHAAARPEWNVAVQRGDRPRPSWRGARGPLAVLAFVAFGVIIIVLLAPKAKSNTYLDPGGKDITGTKALADILGERGFRVTSVYSPADALAAIGTQPRHAGPAATL